MSAERNAYHERWRTRKAKEDPFYSHKKALKELYKTTKEWYDEKLSEQGGTCALCPAPQQATNTTKRLSVDHDHNHCPRKRACGKCNRGLLCFNCNKMLGHLEKFISEACITVDSSKNDSWTARALRYLQQYQH